MLFLLCCSLTYFCFAFIFFACFNFPIFCQVAIKDMIGMSQLNNPVMKESDCLNDLMRKFCEKGCRRIVIKDDNGIVTKVISQYAFIRFLDTNIRTSWFPGLLNSTVLSLGMITTRYIFSLSCLVSFVFFCFWLLFLFRFRYCFYVCFGAFVLFLDLKINIWL